MTLHLPDNFLQWLNARTAAHSHRQLLVISGDQGWTEEVAALCLDHLKMRSCLLVDFETDLNQPSTTHISADQFRQALGQEFDHLIYNGFAGFRASALMALSGVVKASGLMILLCPDFNAWPQLSDPKRAQRVSHGFTDIANKNRFLQWLQKNIVEDEYTAVLTPSSFAGKLARVSKPDEPAPAPFASVSQQRAHDHIVSMMKNKRRQYLVLTADRGRGKSSALGLAAKTLGDKASIIVTAPARVAVNQVFQHAGDSAANQERSLRYLPVDELLATRHQADMLFIDEAAAIPTSSLKSLCERYKRIVFSSTVHGYEGSGRGFEIRFKPFLNEHVPETRFMHLSQPVRWSEGDCLELFWFNVMLMSENSQNLTYQDTSDLRNLRHKRVSQNELLQDPALMTRVFSLLVNAHYQTSPDDLVRLLDAPDSQLYVTLNHPGEVIAVAQLIDEGGDKLTTIKQDIIAGSRRVNGHMTPQSLAVMMCDSKLVTATYRRVTRIAVNEQARRKGIGHGLLDFIEQSARTDGVDFLSTSFGASESLIEFWGVIGFRGVKLGIRRDTSSGEHSILMLKPLSVLANTLFRTFKKEVVNTLLHQCPRYFRDVSSSLLYAILRMVETEELLTPQDKIALQSLNNHHRTSVTCELSVMRLLISCAGTLPDHAASHAVFLTDKILKASADEVLCHTYQLTGKKQIERRVKEAVLCLCEHMER